MEITETLTEEKKYTTPASELSLQKTIKSLENKGIATFVFETAEEVKKKVFELLPEGAEVMDAISMTLKELGIAKELKGSGKYDSARKKAESMDKNKKRKTLWVADYTIGSVHAVTEEGDVLVASHTGSQLASYAFGSEKVIWVVGTQKIVKDRDEGIKRIYDYCLPLENERTMKAYDSPSSVGKILTIASDKPGRLTLIFLRENIGF